MHSLVLGALALLSATGYAAAEETLKLVAVDASTLKVIGPVSAVRDGVAVNVLSVVPDATAQPAVEFKYQAMGDGSHGELLLPFKLPPSANATGPADMMLVQNENIDYGKSSIFPTYLNLSPPPKSEIVPISFKGKYMYCGAPGSERPWLYFPDVKPDHNPDNIRSGTVHVPHTAGPIFVPTGAKIVHLRRV